MTEIVRVLVVDDAAFMRRTLVKLLRQAPGVEIVGEAGDGREAVEMFGRERPDVVCLDIDMPAMDGLTALKHFMSTRPTPVVVVSSMTDRENIPFELFRLGVIDFFPKPTSLSGALASQTGLLLHLVRNAKRIRVENLVRVPLHLAPQPAAAPQGLRHLLVIGGALGSVGALLRLLALLPPQAQAGLGVACMVPLHQAIVASFEGSLGRLFGWTTVSLVESVSLRTGQVCLLKPGTRVSLSARGECTHDGPSDASLDDLFACVGRAMNVRATLVLLAGSEPDGLEGLAVASGCGSRCYVQDAETALFSTWRPDVPAGVELLGLESLAQTLLDRLSLPAAASGGAR